MQTTRSLVFLLVLAGCTGESVDTHDSGVSPCDWTATSTLAGVSLAAGAVECRWSLADADIGVNVPWTVTVTAATDVTVDMVSCAAVDASGLRFYEIVSADPDAQSADTWCPRCDLGICPVDTDVYTTVAGEWPSTFTWRPRRWDGPSDYGSTPGDLFPAGDYTMVIRAGGTLAADGTPWEVRLSAPLTLTP